MSQDMDSSGGVIAAEGVRVEFGSGAFASVRTVSLCPAPVPLGFTGTGVAWNIDAQGDLSLAGPATVVLDGLPEGLSAFVPGTDDTPMLSLGATSPFAGTLEVPLHRLGTVFAAEDGREREGYVTEPTGLDVLFVVDDSGSMLDYQSTLIATFADALPALLDSGIDFRAGVVTTDLDNPQRSGRMVRASGSSWVDASTPDAADVFGRLASVGADGSGTERGLGAAYLALEVLADTDNAGFQRDEASLAVVVVSDEDDATQPSMITVPEFADWLLEVRPLPAVGALHAIVHPDDSGGRLIDPVGAAYIAVADATDGETVDIDSDDWSPVFDRLIEDGLAATGAGMVLALAPDPSTIEAWWVPGVGPQERLAHTFVAEDIRVEVVLDGADPDNVVIVYQAL